MISRPLIATLIAVAAFVAPALARADDDEAPIAPRARVMVLPEGEGGFVLVDLAGVDAPTGSRLVRYRRDGEPSAVLRVMRRMEIAAGRAHGLCEVITIDRGAPLHEGDLLHAIAPKEGEELDPTPAPAPAAPKRPAQPPARWSSRDPRVAPPPPEPEPTPAPAPPPEVPSSASSSDPGAAPPDVEPDPDAAPAAPGFLSLGRRAAIDEAVTRSAHWLREIRRAVASEDADAPGRLAHAIAQLRTTTAELVELSGSEAPGSPTTAPASPSPTTAAAPTAAPTPPATAAPPPADAPPGFLGIYTDTSDPAPWRSLYGLAGGVRVAEAAADRAAARAGLAAGDVILEIDGAPVADGEALGAVLRGRRVGEQLRIAVFRDGRRLELTAVLLPR